MDNSEGLLERLLAVSREELEEENGALEEEVSMEQLKSSGNLVVGVGLSLSRPCDVTTEPDPLSEVNRSELGVKTYSKISTNSTRPSVPHMYIKPEEENSDQKSLIELCHKCPVCLFSSSCLKTWREHLKCKHLQNVEYLSCPYQCGYNSHLNGVVDHIFLKHKNARLVPCNQCFFFTPSKEKLFEHIRASHRFKCTDYQSVADDKASLENHAKAIHSVEDKESKAFHLTGKDSCASHILKSKPNIPRTFYEPKKHKCFELDGKQNFVCLLCPFAAPNPLLLDTHMSEQHEGERCSFSCPTCDFETTNADSMVSHFKKTHKPISNLQCIYCDFIAVSESEISTHILEHIYASTMKGEGNEFPQSKLKSMNECKISKTEPYDDKKSFDLKNVLKMPDQRESMKFDFDDLDFNEEIQSKDPLAISDSNPVESSNEFRKECKRSSSDAPFDVVDLNKLLHKRMKLTPSDHIIEIDEASEVLPEGNPKAPLISSADEKSEVLPEGNPQTSLTTPPDDAVIDLNLEEEEERPSSPETECIVIESDEEEEEVPDNETSKLSLQVIHLNEEERAVLSSNFSDEDVQNADSDCTVFRIVESEGEVQVENVSEKLKSSSSTPQLMMIENLKYYDDSCLTPPNFDGENVTQLENEPIVRVDTNVESSLQPLCSKPPKLGKEIDKSASSSFVSSSSVSKSTSTMSQVRRNLSQKIQNRYTSILKSKICSKNVEEPSSAVKGKAACHNVETQVNLSSISSPVVVDLESESKQTSDISQNQKIKEVNEECSTDVTFEGENRLEHVKTPFSANLIAKEAWSTQGGRNETSELEVTSVSSPSQSRLRLKAISSITHKRTPSSFVVSREEGQPTRTFHTTVMNTKNSASSVVDQPTISYSLKIKDVKTINENNSAEAGCENKNREEWLTRTSHMTALERKMNPENSIPTGGAFTNILELKPTSTITHTLKIKNVNQINEACLRLKNLLTRLNSANDEPDEDSSSEILHDPSPQLKSTVISSPEIVDLTSELKPASTISHSLEIKNVKQINGKYLNHAKLEDQKHLKPVREPLSGNMPLKEACLTQNPLGKALEFNMNAENSASPRIADAKKRESKSTSTISDTPKIRDVKQTNETYSTDVNCQGILSGNVRLGKELLTETAQISSPGLRSNSKEESAPPLTSPDFPVGKKKTSLARADIPGQVLRRENLFSSETLQKAIDSCIEKKLEEASSFRGGILTSPQVTCTRLKDKPNSQSQSVNWTSLLPPKNQGNDAPRQSEEPLFAICSFCYAQFPNPTELKHHIFANHLEQYLHRSTQKLKRPSDLSRSEISQDGKKQHLETSRRTGDHDKSKIRPDDQSSPHIQPNTSNQKEDGSKIDSDLKSITCPHCLLSLSPKQMDQHIFRMHPQHYPFPCFKCKKRFVTLEERRKHSQTDHMSCCPDCKFKTSVKTKYLKHLEEKHAKHTCKSCSRKYMSASGIPPKDNNIFLQLSCSECSFATNNFTDLRSHTSAHQERKASGRPAKTCHLCGIEE